MVNGYTRSGDQSTVGDVSLGTHERTSARMKSDKQHPLRAKLGVLLVIVAVDGALLGGAWCIAPSPSARVAPPVYQTHDVSRLTGGGARPLAAMFCRPNLC
jgi:hypothetical protein